MKNTLITVTMASLLISGCASKNGIMEDDKEIMKIEKISKSDIKQNDFIKETALHDAVRAKNLEIVELLVSQNAKINSQNMEGYTPLHLAVRLKEYEIVEFLIENGASVNTLDKYNDTPLLDSTRDNYVDISKLLICKGANRDVMDEHNMTPLHNSSKNKNIDLSNMLLADNLDPFCKTDEEQMEEKIEIEEIPEVEEELPEIIEEITENKEEIETNDIVFEGLYDSLISEFKNDFDIWDAELTENDLVFRFNNPLALFELGKSDLKVGFTNILSDFFPRYLKVLEQHKDKIEEIRIEGHTSSEYRGATNDNQKYILNKNLSEKRAKEVQNYVVNVASKMDSLDREWAENKFHGYGMSSDNLLLNSDGSEDIIASRRVEFKIIRVDQ